MTENAFIKLFFAGMLTITLGSLTNAADLINKDVTDLVSNSRLTFARAIGGDGYEYLVRMVTTNEGILVSGTTFKSVSDTTDILLTKMTLDGKITQSMLYGGTHKDVLNNIIKTSDGGFLLLAASQSLFYTFMNFMSPSAPSDRPLVIKLKADLSVEWAQIYQKWLDYKFCDAIEHDNGFVLAGYDPKGQGITVDVNKAGKYKGANTYNNGTFLYFVNNGEKSLAIGGIDTTNATELVLTAFNQDIATNNAKVIYSPGMYYSPMGLTLTSDNGCIVNGCVSTIDNNKKESSKAFLAKFDKNQKLEWIHTFGGNVDTRALSVAYLGRTEKRF